MPAKLGRLPSLIGEPAGGSLTADQWLLFATVVAPLAVCEPPLAQPSNLSFIIRFHKSGRNLCRQQILPLQTFYKVVHRRSQQLVRKHLQLHEPLQLPNVQWLQQTDQHQAALKQIVFGALVVR